jgi:N-acylneuraminate cytidylyltransferase
MMKQNPNGIDYIKANSERIKFLFMDCDGVLTDGGMYYSERGDELKKFNTRDGMGIKLLRQLGIRTAIITGEKTKLVAQRGKKLKIDEVCLGVEDKARVLEEILCKYDMGFNEAAYIGDDINDLEAMKKVGLSFAVNDAMQCVKDIADYVTKTAGGHGAVREVAELIIHFRE